MLKTYFLKKFRLINQIFLSLSERNTFLFSTTLSPDNFEKKLIGIDITFNFSTFTISTLPMALTSRVKKKYFQTKIYGIAQNFSIVYLEKLMLIVLRTGALP